jgi:hypothetical protein
MTDPGYYDQSYPPSLWAPAEPVLAGARAAEDTPPPAETPAPPGGGDAPRTAAGSPPPDEAVTAGTSPLTVAAGAPGTYDPPQTPAQRPRNVTELRERARPADRAPWPEHAYVLVGESGKRAHWDGSDWRSGDSPGYPATGAIPALPYSARDTPGTQFPGRGDGSQDLTR